MKNIFKHVAMVAMSIVALSLTACDPTPETPDPEPDPTIASSLYAFQYNNQTMAAGDTIHFHPDRNQISNDMAQVNFYMVNKTEQELPTVMKVDLVSGPNELKTLEICYSGSCRTYSCPWTSENFTLVPGVNTDLLMTIDYAPSVINGESIYRITIGKGTAMEESQVMFLSMYAE